ncbi:MAG: hypothetical protein PHN44_01900 [Candidatus Marinimicrobia bacterium]|jgi:hypothetical protein|nr:hypothetical protein [Candidatus Neomarinimicrobiota bacterium]MDD5540440.1 hypothetical protein [Candidatus Neomarinimicrobiota bacterium]
MVWWVGDYGVRFIDCSLLDGIVEDDNNLPCRPNNLRMYFYVNL